MYFKYFNLPNKLQLSMLEKKILSTHQELEKLETESPDNTEGIKKLLRKIHSLVLKRNETREHVWN